MFGLLKKGFNAIYSAVTSKLSGIFARNSIDQETLNELEKILISADTGVIITKQIITNLSAQVRSGTINQGSDLHNALKNELLQLIIEKPLPSSNIFLLVGINGSGKTTFAGKLAHKLNQEGKRVLLVAADTFRAAAPEQLNQWATSAGADILIGKPQQEPASVVFEGCEKFKTGNYDALIIDTAGRLQTKINLMRELEKIKKIIARQLPETPFNTLLVVDAMLGQNSFEQAKLFHESTPLDGIVLSKIDGTGKGGIIFSISQQLNIPVAFLSCGEKLNNLMTFNAQQYVHDLLEHTHE